MNLFAIIETENGMTIVEYQPTDDVAAVAEANGGVLVDPGPYKTFDEAYDELLNLEPDNEEL